MASRETSCPVDIGPRHLQIPGAISAYAEHGSVMVFGEYRITRVILSTDVTNQP
jgi:hypothetical protein